MYEEMYSSPRATPVDGRRHLTRRVAKLQKEIRDSMNVDANLSVGEFYQAQGRGFGASTIECGI